MENAVSTGTTRSRLWRAISILLWLALLGLLGVLALPWVAPLPGLPAPVRAWCALVANFFPALTLAAFALALFGLILRRRRAMALAGLCLGMGGLPVLAALHGSPQLDPEIQTLSVMTFNVWVGNDQTDRIVAYLRAKHPDIVFLEEVTELHKQAFAPLADLYPTQVTCHDSQARCETMILSRFPAHWARSGFIEGAAPPTAIAALDLGGGRTLTAVAVHLAQPFPGRRHDPQREQALHFAAGLSEYAGPVLVGGDFNGGLWARNQSDVESIAGLTGEPGLHPSWPAIPIDGYRLPAWLRLPIDHILARGGPVVISAKTGPKLGSDHLPLLATVALTDAGR